MWNILTNRYISIRTICRTTEFFSMASSTSTLLLDTYYYLSRTHCSDNADAPLYSNHFLSLSGQELVAHITVNEGKNTEYLWKEQVFNPLYIHNQAIETCLECKFLQSENTGQTHQNSIPLHCVVLAVLLSAFRLITSAFRHDTPA